MSISVQGLGSDRVLSVLVFNVRVFSVQVLRE
jgi:hypothetical protein